MDIADLRSQVSYWRGCAQQDNNKTTSTNMNNGNYKDPEVYAKGCSMVGLAKEVGRESQRCDAQVSEVVCPAVGGTGTSDSGMTADLGDNVLDTPATNQHDGKYVDTQDGEVQPAIKVDSTTAEDGCSSPAANYKQEHPQQQLQQVDLSDHIVIEDVVNNACGNESIPQSIPRLLLPHEAGPAKYNANHVTEDIVGKESLNNTIAKDMFEDNQVEGHDLEVVVPLPVVGDVVVSGTGGGACGHKQMDQLAPEVSIDGPHERHDPHDTMAGSCLGPVANYNKEASSSKELALIFPRISPESDDSGSIDSYIDGDDEDNGDTWDYSSDASDMFENSNMGSESVVPVVGGTGASGSGDAKYNGQQQGWAQKEDEYTD